MKISITIDHEDGSPAMDLGWKLDDVQGAEFPGVLAAMVDAARREIAEHKAPEKVAA